MRNLLVSINKRTIEVYACKVQDKQVLPYRGAEKNIGTWEASCGRGIGP
jgi:hypothetical protein